MKVKRGYRFSLITLKRKVLLCLSILLIWSVVCAAANTKLNAGINVTGSAVRSASASIALDTTRINYDELIQRIHRTQLSSVSSVISLDSQVITDLKMLDTITGKYKDLDYSDHKRIGVDWLPALGRINRMTLACSHPKSRFYHDKVLYKYINASLAFFCRFKPLPYCNNWYQQGITRPQSLALSLINIKATGLQLPDRTWQLTIHAICKDTAVGSPGRNNPMHRYNNAANKAEISLGWLYIGALIQSTHMLAVGARELYAPLKFTEGEGIQYDNSFDMHYGYLYNGAYGAVLLNSITMGAWYLRGSQYSLRGQQLSFFRDFITASVFDQIRGQSMDWNILGRGISRYNATRPDFSGALSKLVIDPLYKKVYRNIRRRTTGRRSPSYSVKAAHQHFWQTDFTVHQRPEFYLSIHGVSSRNHAQEIGNQENLKGYWGAEGVMDLMVSGKEYTNIFPLWNWKRLPGATLPDTLVVPKDKAPGEGDRMGTSLFCGGVSDSLDGVTVYEIKNDLGLYAKKAWFMMGKVIYCLGTGIHSELNKEIRTNLNQCFFDSAGSIIGSRGKTAAIKSVIDTVFGQSPDFILHGDIAYLPLGENALELKVANRISDWKAINSANYPIQNGAVFELSINHGIRPSDAHYSYALLPGVHSIKKVRKFLGKQNTTSRVIINTDSLQAVYELDKGLGQFVFYKKNVMAQFLDFSIRPDNPCLIMMRKSHKNKYKLSVSDPTGKLRELNLHIATIHFGRGDHYKKYIKTYKIALPQGPYAGKTVAIELSF